MMTVAGDRCCVGSAASAPAPARNVVHNPYILVGRHVGKVFLQDLERDCGHLLRRQTRVDAADLQRLVQPLDMTFQLEWLMPEGARRLRHRVPQRHRAVEDRNLRLRRREHFSADIDQVFAGVVLHRFLLPLTAFGEPPLSCPIALVLLRLSYCHCTPTPGSGNPFSLRHSPVMRRSAVPFAARCETPNPTSVLPKLVRKLQLTNAFSCGMLRSVTWPPKGIQQ